MNHQELHPFMFNWDLNWYFNASNIRNQDAIFSTKQFIEQYRAEETNTLDFFNLLFKQKDTIAEYLDRPLDYLSHLQSIPLSETLRHTLYGMLLYWHGGSADSLLDTDNNSSSWKTILFRL